MFKKPRRVARKIERDDDDDEPSPQQTSNKTGADEQPIPSVVKRPTIQSKLAKAKKSAVRTSFAANAADDALGDADAPSTDDAFAVLERKRAAVQSNRASLASSRIPYRSPDASESGPAYDAEYLATLRNEQQTAPPPRAAEDEDVELDVAAKFGADYKPAAVPPSSAAIPTDAEIREKKERRRRLAQEHKPDDFIALDDGAAAGNASASDSDAEPRQGPLILTAEERARAPKYPESRLGEAAVDDDDFAEGFDEFVDDPGRVALGRKALREQEARRRADIAAQIRDGDGDDDDDDDDDPEERARLRAYEAAQTRHGTYGERHTASGHRDRDGAKAREQRWRRIVTRQYVPRPLPDLKTAVARFKGLVEEQRMERVKAEQRLEAIQRERREIEKEEERVQGLVREAGENLERVTLEQKKIEGGKTVEQDVVGADAEVARAENEDEDDDDDEGEDGGGSPAGLGFGNARGGLGMHAGLGTGSLADRPTSFPGMAAPPSPEW